MMKPASMFMTASLLLGLATSAVAGPEKECGSLEWNYGPFDYRIANNQQKHIVEYAHFTPGVETLTEGMTGPFGVDIAYTLRVFPNHPRALLAMERLVAKERKNPPQSAKLTIECWYERAIRFKPTDHTPRLLYVNFLIKRNQQDEARKHLEYVASTTTDNPIAQFNVGMLYVDIKDYDKALEQAHRVMALGIDRRELRDRLAAVGRWVEPEPAGAASAPEPASAASR